jgi:preprotein translocase subunit SecF
MRKSFFIVLLFSLSISICNAQFFHKKGSRHVEKGLFGKSPGKRKTLKVKGPRTVNKAKKKQEANQQRLKNDYAQSIKRSQKRTIAIQTPDVQERMKQNQKSFAQRDKTKRRKTKSGSSKARRKYR